MTDIPDDEDEPMLSFDDAYNIASKIIEMADRVKAANAAVPGVEAKWFFESEDTRFKVVLRVAKPDER